MNPDNVTNGNRPKARRLLVVDCGCLKSLAIFASSSPRSWEAALGTKLIANAALILLTVAALGSARGQSNSSACNNRLIQDNYGSAIQGNELGGQGPTGPQVGVAMASGSFFCGSANGFVPGAVRGFTWPSDGDSLAAGIANEASESDWE